jgi:tetratricopeptide (TPR) repeat protein
VSHQLKCAIRGVLPQRNVAEALQQVRKAADLDPLSESCQESLAFVLLAARRYREALETSRRVLAVNPGAAFAAQIQARALLLEGKPHDAVVTLEQRGPSAHGYLGYAYAVLGRHDDAKRLAEQDDPAASRHRVLIYTALGQRDRAFEALQALAKLDDFMADVYPVLPELAPLQDDVPMKEFRRRRNLPPVRASDFSRVF